MTDPQKLYSITTAAGRKSLAERLASALNRVEGVEVTAEPCSYDSRRIDVVARAEGVRCSVDIDGDSKWGVIASWNFDHATRAGRLFTPGFQGLVGSGGRAHHKATGPFMGNTGRPLPIQEFHVDTFAAIINRAMRNVISGKAFEIEARND